MPTNKSQIILGIDPGIADTGFGVIKKTGCTLELIEYGCIKTSSKTACAERLKEIYFCLNQIIKKYKPEIIGIEQLFFCKNVKTATAVGQARGVILLAAAENNLHIKEFTPLQVKLGMTSYGKAEKSQIQQMVKSVLCLKNIPKPDDAADALAIAICCGNSFLNK